MLNMAFHGITNITLEPIRDIPNNTGFTRTMTITYRDYTGLLQTQRIGLYADQEAELRLLHPRLVEEELV